MRTCCINVKTAAEISKEFGRITKKIFLRRFELELIVMKMPLMRRFDSRYRTPYLYILTHTDNIPILPIITKQF